MAITTTISFESNVKRVKDITDDLNSTKSQDAIVTKALSAALYLVAESLAKTEDSVLIATANLAVLESVCSCRFLSHGKSLQSIMRSIYSHILSKAPGYVVRNIALSMIAIINNKVMSTGSREVAVLILAVVFEKRPFDCGSLLADVIATLSKLLKGIDTSLKVATLQTFAAIIAGGGTRIADCHAEVLRITGKFSSDRSSFQIRLAAIDLVAAITIHSSGCSSVPAESLVSLLSKGLDDDVSVLVQDASCKSLALINREQYRAYCRQQEDTKIGLARGGAAERGMGGSYPGSPVSSTHSKKKNSSSSSAGSSTATSSTIQRIAKLNITSSVTGTAVQKKATEDFQIRAVVGRMIANITKSAGILRNSHIAVLSYFIRDTLHSLEQHDFEWLVQTIVEVIKDPALLTLSFEEMAFFRARIAHLLSHSVVSLLPEARLLPLVGLLVQHVAGMEARTDNELQLVLCTLSSTILVLGEAALSAFDEVQSVVTTYLRSSSFAVRASSAHVLESLAAVVPGVAAGLLHTSLTNASAQAKQLMEESEKESSKKNPSLLGENKAQTTDVSLNDNDNEAFTTVGNELARDRDRLNRMFFFHGHTLVISLLVKKNNLPSGLPHELEREVLAFGLELLQYNVIAAPIAVRNIACSMVRAGSLIVSSYLNTGYSACHAYLTSILQACEVVLMLTDGPGPSPVTNTSPQPGPGGQDTSGDLLYELMSVEAALVCISNLLASCPDALTRNPDCQSIIVTQLEKAFTCVKNRYQPTFRQHFRFRTLHIVLLECFSRLPKGSFPRSCQAVYLEALNVFSDSLAGGFESTCLVDLAEADIAILSSSSSSSLAAGGAAGTPSTASSSRTAAGAGRSAFTFSSVYCEAPLSQDLITLKLEQYAMALQKKESEAFLTSFGKGTDERDGGSMWTSDDIGGGLAARPIDIYRWYNKTMLAHTDSRPLNDHTRRHSSSRYHENTIRLPPCSQIDARTIDVAIAVIGLTFGFQNSEYQDKTVQLCSSALSQLSKASSTLGMFSSEDDKRRKDRRSFLAAKNTTACLATIVHSFPFDSPSLIPHVSFGWTQPVVEHMLDAVASSLLSIRSVAANALAKLAGNMTRSSLLDSVFAQLSSSITDSSSDKKIPEDMSELSGAVFALGALFRQAHNRPVTQKNILSNLLDLLRRVDMSLSFRAHAILAVDAATQALSSNRSGLTATELLSLLERLCLTAEVQGVSIGTSEESDALYSCLQRFHCSAVRLAFSFRKDLETQVMIFMSSSNNNNNTEALSAISDIDGIVKRLIRQWELIHNMYITRIDTIYYVNLHSVSILTEVFTSETRGDFKSLLSVDVAIRILKQALHARPGCGVPRILLAAVEAVSALSERYPREAYTAQLDVSLYLLLNWSVSHTHISPAITHMGLDTKCGGQVDPAFFTALEDLQLLRALVEETLVAMSLRFADLDLDRHAIRCILFCRAVALSLHADSDADGVNPASSGAGGINDAGEGDFGGDFSPRRRGSDADGFDPSTLAGSTSRLPRNTETDMTVTWQSFLSRCREEAVCRAEPLQSISVFVKSIAVRIAVNIVARLRYEAPRLSVCHRDILRARAVTQEILRENGPGTEDQSPSYLSLFLSEIVNLGCACTTYTINDKTLICLQQEALQLLCLVVRMFENTADPDVVDAFSITRGVGAQSTVGEKILTQSISQILSAVRSCLNAPWTRSPQLQLLSGSLVCDLVRGGFVSDKVVLKRLVKALLPSSNQYPTSAGIDDITLTAPAERGMTATATERVRSPPSPDVSDTMSFLRHLLRAHTGAALHICAAYGEVNDAVKTTIRGILRENFPLSESVWRALVVDAARVLQLPPTPAAPSLLSSSSTGEAVTSDKDVVEWRPTGVSESDPRRGGSMYNPSVDLVAVYPYLVHTLPIALASATSSSSGGSSSTGETVGNDDSSEVDFHLSMSVAMFHRLLTATGIEKPLAHDFYDAFAGATASDRVAADTASILSALCSLTKSAGATVTLSDDRASLWCSILKIFPIAVAMPLRPLLSDYLGERRKETVSDELVESNAVKKLVGVLNVMEALCISLQPVASVDDSQKSKTLRVLQALWSSSLTLLVIVMPSIFLSPDDGVTFDSILESVNQGKLPAIYAVPLSSPNAQRMIVSSVMYSASIVKSGAYTKGLNVSYVIDILISVLGCWKSWAEVAGGLSECFSEYGVLREYVVYTLVALIPQTALMTNTIDTSGNSSTNFGSPSVLSAHVLNRLISISSDVTDRHSDFTSSPSDILEYILDNLSEWGDFFAFVTSSSKGQSGATHSSEPGSTFSSFQLSRAVVVESSLSAWMKLALHGSSKGMVPSSPIQLTILVLRSHSASADSEFTASLLRYLCQIMQSSSAVASSMSSGAGVSPSAVSLIHLMGATLSSILPAVLSSLRVLGEENDTTAEGGDVGTALVHFVFSCFPFIAEDKRGDYLALVVPAICGVVGGHMDHREQKELILNAPIGEAVGVGLAQLAGTCPEHFKAYVMSVPDSAKFLLQNLMKHGVMKQQQQGGYGGGGAGPVYEKMKTPAEGSGLEGRAASIHLAPPSLKKIDLSKYRSK